MASTSFRLFEENLNIIYDSKCNVCKFEIDFLARRDQRMNNPPKLKMTDLESSVYNPNDPANANISYAQALASMHAVTADGKVLNGVPVFREAYEQVGLGWVFAITTWPVVKTIADLGYNLFAKYRTNLTRNSSVEDLIQAYEARQNVKNAGGEDCDVCQTKSP
jgi:predicted DCC family thiol-disulfide oxidoreductase YuxK